MGRIILSGHQPVYLPGAIYFSKIAASDLFMHVGHCQFTQKSWQIRNRINLNDSEHWLSIPVMKSGRFGQSIDDTVILPGNWKRKHLLSIKSAYHKEKYFDLYFPDIEKLIMEDIKFLGEFNKKITYYFLKKFEIKTKILDSVDFKIEGSKTDMLISMCKAVGANHYLSNEGSRAYIDEVNMRDNGIQHNWLAFNHPKYKLLRVNSLMLEDMSAVELLFVAGPLSGDLIKKSGEIA